MKTIWEGLRHFCGGRPAMIAAVGCVVGVSAFSQVSTSPTTTSGTGTTSGPTSSHLAVATLPIDAKNFASAIGPRLTVAGLEQTKLAGNYNDGSGAAAVSLTWQNPGLVSVNIQGAKARTITFDGTKATVSGGGTIAAIDQDLLETLTDDYADAFFFNLAAGAGYRFLGARFRNDDGKTPNYAGPYYDICEKVGAVPASKLMTQKVYMFDSTTGLLAKVAYIRGTGAAAIPIETQFSNWQSSNGGSTPGTITRYSGRAVEFTVTLGSGVAAAATSVTAFQAQ